MFSQESRKEKKMKFFDFEVDEIKELKEQVDSLNLTIANLKKENLELKAEVDKYRGKDASISEAIVVAVEKANQIENSSKKLYQLEIQRIRLLYVRMEKVLSDLYIKYPELKKDEKLNDMNEKFKQIVYSNLDQNIADIKPKEEVKQQEDPFKKLLSNLTMYLEKKEPEKQVASIQTMPKTSSGFDFNEALHPTDSLDDILKAFDLEDDED